MNIVDLPDLVLIEIFVKLPAFDRIIIESVCRHWRFLLKNFVWKHEECKVLDILITESNRSKIEQSILSCLQRGGHNITKLKVKSLAPIIYSPDNWLSVLVSSCPNLSVLEIHMRLDSSSLNILGGIASHLEYISFDSCFCYIKSRLLRTLRFNYDSEMGLADLLQKCGNLKSLKVINNPKIIGSCVFEVLPELIHLDIRNCNIKDEALVPYLDRCKSLQTLALTLTAVNIYGPNPILLNAIKRSTNLKAIKIQLKESPSSIAKVEVQQHFYNLPEITLILEEPYTNSDEQLIFFNFENMKILTLVYGGCANADNQTIASIVSSCPNLIFLRLKSECTLSSVKSGLEKLNELQFLQYLDLSKTGITDSILQKLANVGKLKALSLDNCPNITDAGILNILQMCKDLKWLSIKHCTNVTNNMLKNLPIIHCKNEISLYIWTYGCGIITSPQSNFPSIRIYNGEHERMRMNQFKNACR